MTEIEKKPAPGRRMQIITRVTPAMHEVLDGIAAASGRSLAQEVEMRVERTLRDDEEARNRPPMSESPGLKILLRYISRAFSFMEQLSGDTWHEDDAANAVMQDLMIQMVVHCFQAQSLSALSEEDRKRVAHMIEAEEHVVDLMLWRNFKSAEVLPNHSEPRPTAIGEHRKHIEERAAKEAEPSPDPAPRRRAPRLSKLAKDGPIQQATPDQIAAATPARGLLPPEISDRAAFDDAVSGLPLEKAEKPIPSRKPRAMQTNMPDTGGSAPRAPRKRGMVPEV